MKTKDLKFEYDAEVDAAYLTLRAGKIVGSEEAQPGLVVDFDANDQIVGVEILRFGKRFKPSARKHKRAAALR